jgi:hydroxymethylglutaryl-CoA lyase
VRARRRRLEDCIIEGGVGTAFGCTLQGQVSTGEVLRLMQALLDAGADRVSLADTVGYADPRDGRALFTRRWKSPARAWCGHFHDTRGLALANVYAALRLAWRASMPRWPASAVARMRRAPAATRPPKTWLYMLASMGLDTGVDLPALLALRAEVAGWLRRRNPARRAVARRPAQDFAAIGLNPKPHEHP